jgi:Rieske Fe-S protein
MDENKDVSRRDFMKMAISAIGGAIGLAYAIPAIGYIVGPALKKDQAQDWIRLGSTAKVELGVPTLFKISVPRQTGWITTEEEVAVYVLTENGRDYLVMSNVCTHLGCRVRWIAEQDQFFCPCHNGIFDKTGNVVDGPPPRPLDRFLVKVENDQISIILGG